MSITSVGRSTTINPMHSSFEPVRSPSRAATRHDVIDSFVRTNSDPWTHTPITDALVVNIKSPSTPVSEKLALALLTPILVPLTVALDVVLWPFVKIQQVSNWVQSKFS